MIELNFTKAELLRSPGIGKRTAEAVEEFLSHQGYMFATKDEKEIDKAVAMLRNHGFRVELPALSSNDWNDGLDHI